MKLLSNLIDKKVVIWGLGTYQTDFEGLANVKVYCYVADTEEKKKDGIPVYLPDEFIASNIDNSFVVICEEDEEKVEEYLLQAGRIYGQDFLPVDEFFMDYSVYENIAGKKVYLYGAGNTYVYFKEDIFGYLPNLAGFLITGNTETAQIDGLDVRNIQDTALTEEDYIVVTSIYYDEIAQELTRRGLRAGKNYIHIYSFMRIARLSCNVHGEYDFTDRTHGWKQGLVILAGYKPFVWEEVFGRLKEYVPDTIDVCMVTSGLVNEDLKKLCKEYGWSYVSTKMNNVSFAVNVGVMLLKEAEYIYKIDEDIFVTDGTFKVMMDTYQEVQKNSDYEVGFVTPAIPVNGFGYVDILKRLQLEEEWEKRFGKLVYTDCYHHHRAIHDNEEAALFMWGKYNSKLADIDKINDMLKADEFSYEICPIRYSIGFILFKRENWIRMGLFPVSKHTNMGADEIEICKYCLMSGRAIVESKNTIVGHLSYGPQHKVMERFYHEHKDRFQVKKKAVKYG